MKTDQSLADRVTELRTELLEGTIEPRVGFMALLDLESVATLAVESVADDYWLLRKECNELLSSATDKVLFGYILAGPYHM